MQKYLFFPFCSLVSAILVKRKEGIFTLTVFQTKHMDFLSSKFKLVNMENGLQAPKVNSYLKFRNQSIEN